MADSGQQDEPIRVPALFQVGWFRWMPHAAIHVEDLLHRFPGAPRHDVTGALRLLAARQRGLQPDPEDDPQTLVIGLPPAPVWEEPTPPRTSEGFLAATEQVSIGECRQWAALAVGSPTAAAARAAVEALAAQAAKAHR